MSETFIAFKGGFDQFKPSTEVNPGSIVNGVNIYEDIRGGYRRVQGYQRSMPTDKVLSDWSVFVITVTDYASASGDVYSGYQLIEANGGTARFKKVTYESIPSDLTTWLPQLGVTVFSIEEDAASPTEFAIFNQDKINAYAAYCIGTTSPELARPLVNGSNPLNIVPSSDGKALTGNVSALNGALDTDPLADQPALVRITTTASYVPLRGDTLAAGVDIIEIWSDYDGGAILANSYLCYLTSAKSFTHADVTRVDSIKVEATSGSIGYGSFTTTYIDKPQTFAWINGIPLVNAESKWLPIYLPDGNTVNCMARFRDRLVVGTDDGRLILSVPNEPYSFHGSLYAVEIQVGAPITGLQTTGDGRLFIFTENKTQVLSGSTSDFQLNDVSTSVGALLNGSCYLDDVYTIDSRGIHRISLLDATSGFDLQPVSTPVGARFKTLRPAFTGITVHKDMSQVRFWFGAIALSLTLIFESEGRRLSWSEIEFGKAPKGFASGTETHITFGDDEHIYKMDYGESFAGESYMGFFLNEFNSLGNPAQDKRYRNMFLEFKAKTAYGISLIYSTDYAKSEYSKDITASPTDQYGFGYDIASYDDSFYDIIPMERAKVSLSGSGFNFRAGFRLETAYLPSPIFYGYVLRFDPRGNI
tara:strand:- start:705 stop:2636 length:1932 start_codon:yes stop_codon:yes gene_type:complete